jgi:hypothetical protein
VFEFSHGGSKNPRDTIPLEEEEEPTGGGGTHRRSRASAVGAESPSTELSGRVGGRGQASNRADMNRESELHTYEDAGSNSKKDLRRSSTMQDIPILQRRQKESERAGVARSKLSRQRSDSSVVTPPLSGRDDYVATLENTVRIYVSECQLTMQLSACLCMLFFSN